MSLKKAFVGIVGFILLSLVFNSCKKDPLNPTSSLETKCENGLNAASTAAEAFVSNPTSSTCETYKDGLLDYVNSCAGYAYYNASYEDAIASIDCSVYDE